MKNNKAIVMLEAKIFLVMVYFIPEKGGAESPPF